MQYYPGLNFDDPSVNLSEYIDSLDGPSVGRITPTTALGISTISSCVKIVSEDVSTLDIRIEEQVEPDRWEINYKHYLNKFFQDPSDQFGLQTILEATNGNAALSGNGIAPIKKNRRTGQVLSMDIREYTEFNIYRTMDRTKIWYHTVDSQGRPDILDADEVVHIMAFTLNGWTGISPLAMARHNVQMSHSATVYSANNFSSGGFGGGFIETDDDLKAGARLKFAQQVKRAQAIGLYPVLDRGMKITPNKINPKDIDFVNTMKFGKEEIASVYRMPLSMLSAGGKSPGSSYEQQAIQYTNNCLLPWVRRWETELERKLLSPAERQRFRIKFDIQSKARADTRTMTDHYSQMLTNRVMVPNEVRKIKGLPPTEWGDDPIDHQKSAKDAPGGPNIHTISKNQIDEEE